MPRYFFDISDGQGVHVDDIGLDLPDMDAAIDEGRRALSEMSREALAGETTQDIEILIRDGDDGPVRLRLSVSTERPHFNGRAH